MPEKPKEEPRRAKRRAQLVADAVNVCCPWCGEPQPNGNDGSEQWTSKDIGDTIEGLRAGILTCVSCDKAFLLTSDSKVQFS